ncbi:hypothetical protein FQZ97_368070 [compost metagenome]
MRTARPLAQHHRGLAHRRLGQQVRTDLFQFDAETAHLDLLVDAAEELQRAVAPPACQVAAAVQPRAILARHEAFGGQRRTPQVTARQPGAAEQQLRHGTGGHQLQFGVAQLAEHIGQRPADRHPRALLVAAAPMGDVDRGLGRPVAIVQRHLGQPLAHAPAQLAGQRLAAGEQALQAAALADLVFLDEQLQQRRHEMQAGHPVRPHQLRQATRIAMLAIGGQHQAAAGDQRQEAFPDRDVEAERCLLQQHVRGIHRVFAAHPMQPLAQRAVGDADTLGPAGGTGGVDHVGQVVGVQRQGWRGVRIAVGVQVLQRQARQ